MPRAIPKKHSARKKFDSMTKDELKEYMSKKNKRSKYNVKAGTKKRLGYDSQLEKCVADQIYLLEKAGKYIEVKEQFPVTHYVNGVKVAKNIIDFRCTLPDGKYAFIEAKGVETDAFLIKKKLNISMLSTLFPGCEYWIVRGSCKYLRWEQIKLKE